MIKDLAQTLKSKLTPTDRQLEVATKAVKVAAWYSISCVVFWGAAALLGGAVLGVEALGIGIPAMIGISTVALGLGMTVKSILQLEACRAIYKKGVRELDERRIAKGLPPDETTPAKIASIPKLRELYNPKAALGHLKASLPASLVAKFSKPKKVALTHF